jgi:hypothetical protein
LGRRRFPCLLTMTGYEMRCLLPEASWAPSPWPAPDSSWLVRKSSRSDRRTNLSPGVFVPGGRRRRPAPPCDFAARAERWCDAGGTTAITGDHMSQSTPPAEGDSQSTVRPGGLPRSADPSGQNQPAWGVQPPLDQLSVWQPPSWQPPMQQGPAAARKGVGWPLVVALGIVALAIGAVSVPRADSRPGSGPGSRHSPRRNVSATRPRRRWRPQSWTSRARRRIWNASARLPPPAGLSSAMSTRSSRPGSSS